jgi:hypothetical protein
VVSLNEDDTVDITDTSVIGGATDLGLGDQLVDHLGGCGGHEFGELRLNGRQLGFFFRRGFRR